MRIKIFIVFLLLALFSTISFGSSHVGLFIPGVIGGNPIFELTVSGIKRAQTDLKFSLNIVEGGYNPGVWEDEFKAMVLSGRYNIIITLTEGMPHIIQKIAPFFPKGKFILLDGKIEGVKNAYGVKFKDEEMTYLAGVFASYITTSPMKYANPEKKIGIIVGDIYPAMTGELVPGYKRGAKERNKDIKVLFSSVGNWNDPNKGREIAFTQFSQGVDIILDIAGASGIGIIDAARKKGGYVICVDANQNEKAPGIILGSAIKKIDETAYESIKKALENSLPFGKTEIQGIKEGKITFTANDFYFKKYVPSNIQNNMRAIIEKIKKED